MSDPGATFMAPRRVLWTERLSMGVADLDAQHWELCRRLDQFLVALAEKRGRTELAPLVAFLDVHVSQQFYAEQRLMELAGYAALGDHMAEHLRFEERYRELTQELEQKGATFGLARELVRLLVSWVEEHIGEMDRAFGLYLLQSGSFRRRGAAA